jgi:hypothetical protein
MSLTVLTGNVEVSRRQLNVIGWQRRGSDVTNSTMLLSMFLIQAIITKSPEPTPERSVGKKVTYYTTRLCLLLPHAVTILPETRVHKTAMMNFSSLISCIAEALTPF